MEGLPYAGGGQRRARAQLSCTPCRQGKLKCNRSHPACDQCIKRSREDACTYVAPPPKAKQAQNMRGRIRHLENLVVDLMNKNNENYYNRPTTASSQPVPSTEMTGTPGSMPTPESLEDGSPHPDGDSSAQLARLKIRGEGEPTFVGGTHWTSVLEAIDEVKVGLDDEDEDSQPQERPRHPSPPRGSRGTAAILSIAKDASREELLDGIPPKHECDQLIFQWFNSKDPFSYVIHSVAFQDSYKLFWEDHDSASIQWLGLVFSLFGITSMIHEHVAHARQGHGHSYRPKDSERVCKFRDLAASALHLSDFTRPKQYTVEAILMFSQLEYLMEPTSQMKMWIMIGLVIRIALRMGFHRDPRHFPNVTPHEGEMRRRAWHLLLQMDVLISFAVGLPGMIRHVPSDVRPLHNLLDDDFGPESTQLPPERPFSQLTPVSYPIAKGRLCAVFGAAADMSHAIIAPPYAEIMRQDKLLTEAIELIPPPLKKRPMAESITDSPSVVMTRFNLALLSQKTRCILHRKFLIQGQTDPTYAYSRQQCLDGAMTLLQYHSEIYVASQAGGQLETVRWYMSGLSNHDFLLAAMIVCLELNHRYKKGVRGEKPSGREMIVLLEKSYQLWQDGETYQPTDSQLATKALSVMLQRLKKSKIWDPNMSCTPEPQNAPTVSPTSTATSTNQSWPSTTATDPLSVPQSLPDLSEISFPLAGITPAMTAPNDRFSQTNGNGDVSMPDFNPIGDMLDTPFNIDWGSWDQTITAGRDQVQSAMFMMHAASEADATNSLSFDGFDDLNDLDNPNFGNLQFG